MTLFFYIAKIIFTMITFLPERSADHSGNEGAAPPPVASTYEQACFEIAPESRVFIEGLTNINRYSCVTSQISGTSFVYYHDQLRNAKKALVDLSMKVSNIDCGMDAMNDNMEEALKAEKYPDLLFQLTKAVFIDSSSLQNGNPVYYFKVKSKITIAGVTKSIILDVNVTEKGEETFLVKGRKTMNMHDFNITPPLALYGMIKVKEKFTVNFNLVFNAE